ncbi:MAG: metallophosphoesterase [Lentisphaerae bacterium]|nr:metallophosphoesterase [Lentisphaerota bacterium]
MMKKLLLTAFFTACAVFLTASEYSFMALGDIHFDGEAYHSTVPQQAHRRKERKRNLDMWKNGKSDQVLAAAAKQLTPDMPFVVQIGDFTQGDCDGEALQEKMFADAFAAVKKYFPQHKLLAVKGNHDVRTVGVKGACNTPAVKSFLPLIAKELGREKITGNYAVVQGKDLFIFIDSFVGKDTLFNFIDKTLKRYPESRYTFLISHLPLLPCSPGYPVWLIPQYDKLIPILAKRNAVILSAHTHIPSCVSIKTPEGSLAQIVVSSIGCDWKRNEKMAIRAANFEDFCKLISARKMKDKKVVSILDYMKKQQIKMYELYHVTSGFAVIKVKNDSVVAEFYNDESGKPKQIKTLFSTAE